jgi:hypothetical protein
LGRFGVVGVGERQACGGDECRCWVPLGLGLVNGDCEQSGGDVGRSRGCADVGGCSLQRVVEPTRDGCWSVGLREADQPAE